MRIYCNFCGESVSSDIPGAIVFRGSAQCPECAQKEDDRARARLEAEHGKLRELLNAIVFQLGSDIKIGRGLRTECKVCKEPWQSHWKDGVFRCGRVGEALPEDGKAPL